MKPLLANFQEPAYAAMRVVVGLLFACNGAQKLFGAFDGNAVPLMSMPGAAGLIEFLGGLLVLLGLFGAYAAFIASGEMAFAYFMIHFPQAFLPILNGGERAAFYCFVFLFIAARGSGIWSVDALMFGRKSSA
ncbi:MAG: DoxX family protein [Gemmatimonadetes bacterium]|nr:DoxX family protein [Gemmatimonadota bacterium]